MPGLLLSMPVVLGVLAWGAGWKLQCCGVGEQLGLLAGRAWSLGCAVCCPGAAPGLPRAPCPAAFLCSLQSQHLELAAFMASVCSFTCLNKQTICLLPFHPLFLCSSTAQGLSEGSGSSSQRGPHLSQVALSPPRAASSSTVQRSLQFQTKYLQFLKLILVLFKQLPNLMSKESLLCLSYFAEFWDVSGGRGCPATGRGEGGWAQAVPCPGAGCAGSGCAPGSQLCVCSVLCVLVRQVCLH